MHRKIPHFGDVVFANNAWSSKQHRGKGIVGYIIASLIPPMSNNVLVSDGQLTPNGENFWKKLLQKASTSKKLYAVNITSGKLYKYNPNDNFDKWFHNEEFWGNLFSPKRDILFVVK